nr:helix-turn-helix domain-containing protein [Aromatoleum diolicum]
MSLPPFRPRWWHDPDTDSDDERIRVLRMLDDTRWNRSEAVRRLGMTLRQLRYRLEKWGLE